MKKQFVFAVAILALSTIFSCKKADVQMPATLPAEGTWVGKYGPVNATPTYYYAFEFKAGGTMVVKSNDATLPDTGTGTWTISNDSLRSTYTYTSAGSTYSIIGKYDGHANVITGTWGPGNNNTGGGTFTISKQ